MDRLDIELLVDARDGFEVEVLLLAQGFEVAAEPQFTEAGGFW